MEKLNIFRWLKDYNRIVENPNVFIEEYYNKLHPDNQICLTDEDKEYMRKTYGNLGIDAWIESVHNRLEPEVKKYLEKDNPFKVGDIITNKKTRYNKMIVKEIDGDFLICDILNSEKKTECRCLFYSYEKVED